MESVESVYFSVCVIHPLLLYHLLKQLTISSRNSMFTPAVEPFQNCSLETDPGMVLSRFTLYTGNCSTNSKTSVNSASF